MAVKEEPVYGWDMVQPHNGEKRCPKCSKTLPISSFYRRPKRPGGVSSWCRVCHRELGGKYASANRSKINRQRATARRGKFMELLRNFGDRCSKCGYSRCIDALEFHHVGDKQFAISRGMHKPIEELREECSKCIVLCSNCHKELHYNERNNT